jgi:hypothetical protein
MRCAQSKARQRLLTSREPGSAGSHLLPAMSADTGLACPTLRYRGLDESPAAIGQHLVWPEPLIVWSRLPMRSARRGLECDTCLRDVVRQEIVFRFPPT